MRLHCGVSCQRMVGSQLNHSYFFAVEDVRGWGNTSHFTFFSEFNRTSKCSAYIEVSFMTILCVLSILGNVFIIGFVWRYKKSRTITNYFVCNLALADVLFVASAPFISCIRVSKTWRLGKGMCHFLIYELFVCGFVMIWTMAIISIDRYVCINLKSASSRRLKPFHAVLISSLIWIIAFAGFLPVAIFFNVKTVPIATGTISFCTIVLPRSSHFRYSWMFSILLFITGFAVPLSVIIINYSRIFKKIRTSNKAVAPAPTGSVVPFNFTTAHRKWNIRVINTLVLLVVLFIVMWTPLFVVFGYIQIDNSPQYMNLSSQSLIWTIVVAYCNAAINPFLYGFINNSLQRGMRRCRLCGCKKRTSGSHSSVIDQPLTTLTYRTDGTAS